MAQEQIIVEALVDASFDEAWEAYTFPAHVTHWNFASDDWHCPSASANFKEGGTFSSRMEAKDGSFGFDFEGIYTTIIENERIEYTFGHRKAKVEFLPSDDKVLVRVSFDPENEYPVDQQRSGWQAILNNYARYASHD